MPRKGGQYVKDPETGKVYTLAEWKARQKPSKPRDKAKEK